MHTLLEEKLCYPAFALIVLAVFYGIYFGKMLAQKRHGIPHPPNRTQERKRIIYRGDGMPIEQPKTRYDREIRMC